MYGQFINHDLENNQHVGSQTIVDDLAVYVKDRQDTACQATTLPPLPHGYRCGDDDQVLVINIKPSFGELQSDNTIKVFNNASSFLDLDLVYGKTEEVNTKLRTGSGGKLKFFYIMMNL